MMKFIVALFLLVQVIFTVIDQGEAKRVVKSKSRKPFLPSCPSTPSKYLKIAKKSLLEGKRRKRSTPDFPVNCVTLAFMVVNGGLTIHAGIKECCDKCNVPKFLQCLVSHANNPLRLFICRSRAYSCSFRCLLQPSAVRRLARRKCTSKVCTRGKCCLRQQCIKLKTKSLVKRLD
ncbi:uncharacterized protein LOC124444812 [Xenia sp. Carnegie-2017]|uniref:uncharacterized protein LOC124444812 n=1 Tax=Xenia sp. Carnegie-2017 TaxID=2897299 RepID=UPI001F04E843|nr:uncharacterized protein LOC124444812 [Xenia sp. Carnegie-2017]